MITDTALTILRYSYLILLWLFVLSAISLLRRDIFGDRRKKVHGGAPNGAVDRAVDSKIPAHIDTSPPPRITAHTPHIRVIGGIAQGDVFDLQTSQNTFETIIGRSNEATIMIPDSFISGKHARIFLHEGSYFIEDLHSTNGTVVDGREIEGVTKLNSGSQIRIGKNVLELGGQ
jgi:hypothetical protein